MEISSILSNYKTLGSAFHYRLPSTSFCELLSHSPMVPVCWTFFQRNDCQIMPPNMLLYWCDTQQPKLEIWPMSQRSTYIFVQQILSYKKKPLQTGRQYWVQLPAFRWKGLFLWLLHPTLANSVRTNEKRKKCLSVNLSQLHYDLTSTQIEVMSYI